MPPSPPRAPPCWVSGFLARLPARVPGPAAASSSRWPSASQGGREPALRTPAAPFLLPRELHPPPGKRGAASRPAGRWRKRRIPPAAGGAVMAAAGSPASRLRAAAPRAGRGRHPLAAAPRCAARERRWGWCEGPSVALSVSDQPKFSPGAARAEGQRGEPPAEGSAGARRDEAGRHSPAGWLSCSPVTARFRGSDRP